VRPAQRRGERRSRGLARPHSLPRRLCPARWRRRCACVGRGRGCRHIAPSPRPPPAPYALRTRQGVGQVRGPLRRRQHEHRPLIPYKTPDSVVSGGARRQETQPHPGVLRCGGTTARRTMREGAAAFHPCGPHLLSHLERRFCATRWRARIGEGARPVFVGKSASR
jgi:hypothetical protein